MRETVKKTLCGVGLCAAVAGGLLYFENHAAVQPLPVGDASAAESAASELESASLTEDTKEDVEILLQGAESMDSAEVEQLLGEDPAQKETGTQQDAAENSMQAASSSAPETTASSSSGTNAAAPSSSGTSQNQHTAAASSSQAQQDSCDTQIDALVEQLYQQQDRYERELLEIIRQAHQEYVAYQEDQRSLLLKIQVVLGKSDDLTALEKDFDAEVNNICNQMTTILKANGRDTAIVQEVKKTYTDKKAEFKKELIQQTYSGGDGSGSAGHWLYDRLE